MNRGKKITEKNVTIVNAKCGVPHLSYNITMVALLSVLSNVSSNIHKIKYYPLQAQAHVHLGEKTTIEKLPKKTPGIKHYL